jgi:hypothetical protein
VTASRGGVEAVSPSAFTGPAFLADAWHLDDGRLRAVVGWTRIEASGHGPDAADHEDSAARAPPRRSPSISRRCRRMALSAAAGERRWMALRMRAWPSSDRSRRPST